MGLCLYMKKKPTNALTLTFLVETLKTHKSGSSQPIWKKVGCWSGLQASTIEIVIGAKTVLTYLYLYQL